MREPVGQRVVMLSSAIRAKTAIMILAGRSVTTMILKVRQLEVGGGWRAVSDDD